MFPQFHSGIRGTSAREGVIRKRGSFTERSIDQSGTAIFVQIIFVFNHFNMAGGQPQLQTVEEWLEERHFPEEIIKIFTGEKMPDDK